jgi:iron complex outermembrane receptor protein
MSRATDSNGGRILRPLAGAALCVAGLAGPVLAQQTGTTSVANPNNSTASDTSLAEIVVTAQFRQQNLQDAPLAITAVNAAMMEARGQTSLHDLGQQAPNVTLVETGGAFGPGMTASIRGIGQSDFDPAVSPGVGIYIDDVYYTSLTGSNFALLDLDRVEILRGPQGTLAGANSEGGAIKLYTVKPQGGDTGMVKVSAGERSLVDVQAMADVSLIKDYLFMRVSGVSHEQDGFVTRIDYGCQFPTSGIPASSGVSQGCIAGHEGGKDYHGGRIALRWVPSDNFEANLAGDITVDNSQVSPVTLLRVDPTAPGAVAASINSGYPPGNAAGVAYDNRFVPANPYVSYADFCAQGLAGNKECFTPYQTTKSTGVNLTLDWRLMDDLALKSITGFRQLDSQWTNDDDASAIGSSLGYSEIKNHTLTQELRVNGAVAKILDYSVGGFLLDQVTTYDSHQILDYVIPGVPFEFIEDDPVAERDYAGFANATWHIVDALNLNAGVRYTKVRKDYHYNRYNPSSAGGGDSIFFAPGFSGTVGNYSGNKVDYRVNIDYRWNEDLLTYAEVSTGFKSGGTNPRPFIASQVQPFAIESLIAYEVGAKTDWFDRALRVNAAVFYNRYKNIQVTLLSCPAYSGGSTTEPCAAPVNGGDALIYGAELEASYHFAGMTLDASYSHQQFQYQTVNPLAGIPLDATGQGFQPSKWSVGAQYDVTVPNGATISPRLDYIYSAGYFTNASNDANSYQFGYHELNGRVTYKPSGSSWEASVAATNLTNKLWYNQTFDLGATQGQAYGIPAEPRTVWAEFKKKF